MAVSDTPVRPTPVDDERHTWWERSPCGLGRMLIQGVARD